MILDAKQIAFKNIQNKAARSTSLIILTAILTFILFLSSFLIFSLKNGMNSLSDRMGADLIVVPEGYDTKIEGAILRGEPNTFFFDQEVAERIKGLKGVKMSTPQLFIASLSASCCSFPIQVIGIDEESDFLVKPWLETQAKLPLADGSALIGYNVTGDDNGDVKFFNQHFAVEANLAKTGMGFDNSVFLSFKEARRLAKEYEKVLEIEDKYSDNMISCVMIKVEDGVDPVQVQNEIRREFLGEKVYPLLAQSILSEVSNSAKYMTKYVYILIALVWILVFVVLALVYSMIIRERKRELATLRILGATKKHLRDIVLWEIITINLSGSLIGSVLGLAVSILFGRWFSQSFNMPFLSPSPAVFAIIFASVLAIGTLMGPISSLASIKKMNEEELGLLLKQND
ncbi:ABC transporter permease [Ezakiella peruensis]|uniref:ABC transporter permease n=1 Tax=Ezakiella peruensis TaxID=1464038 RepID=UPI000C1B24AF|nr:FtsX-like permease family protein [Ezakiella peruensis]